MTKFASNNKLVSVIFIFTCVIFILLLILLEWDYLTNISYGLHESFAVLINIGIVLIPIEALVWFIGWRRYHRNSSDSIICNTILNIISVLALIACVIIIIFYVNGMTAEGYAKDIEKYSVNEGYYIKLNDKLVEITQQEYNQPEIGKWYHFEYKYNKLIANYYKITLLEEQKE